MGAEKGLLIAYYGDDFTGSTDALEFLSLAGIKTVLFIVPPTAEQLSRHQGIQAIGVAGMTRALSPEAMEEELVPAFEALKELRPGHVHYKVCSTFDSSPTVGSIGKAIEIGSAIFPSPFVPLLVAAPALGRHCAFGNLFAKMGIGSEGKIFRLDRHPSMSKHPVTPADESDLCLHLAKQTKKPIGLIDILQIEKEETEIKVELERLVDAGAEVILLDAIYESQMGKIGRLLDASRRGSVPLFSVGSSGIEMALGAHWKASRLTENVGNWRPIQDKGPILVISGSCSPVTEVQISYALKHGFAEIAIDTEKLLQQEDFPDLLDFYVQQAISFISSGSDLIIHTSRGTNDPRLQSTGSVLKKNAAEKTDTAKLFGSALGTIARRVAEKTSLNRIVIAGGDTSSYAARAMGIEAVEMVAPFSPGAPMCRAIAPGSAINEAEVNFKGGQVGKEDYFTQAKGKLTK